MSQGNNNSNIWRPSEKSDCNNKRDFKDVTIINIINIYYLSKREKRIESVPRKLAHQTLTRNRK